MQKTLRSSKDLPIWLFLFVFGLDAFTNSFLIITELKILKTSIFFQMKSIFTLILKYFIVIFDSGLKSGFATPVTSITAV